MVAAPALDNATVEPVVGELLVVQEGGAKLVKLHVVQVPDAAPAEFLGTIFQ